MVKRLLFEVTFTELKLSLKWLLTQTTWSSLTPEDVCACAVEYLLNVHRRLSCKIIFHLTQIILSISVENKMYVLTQHSTDILLWRFTTIAKIPPAVVSVEACVILQRVVGGKQLFSSEHPWNLGLVCVYVLEFFLFCLLSIYVFLTVRCCQMLLGQFIGEADRALASEPRSAPVRYPCSGPHFP